MFENNNFNNMNNNFNNVQNNYQNVNNNQGNSLVDVPPTLEPIGNLNNAPTASAPTLDALGPMNIMPDSLPETNNNNQNTNIGMDMNNNFENNQNIPETNNNYQQVQSVPTQFNNQFNDTYNNVGSMNENNIYNNYPNSYSQPNLYQQPTTQTNNISTTSIEPQIEINQSSIENYDEIKETNMDLPEIQSDSLETTNKVSNEIREEETSNSQNNDISAQVEISDVSLSEPETLTEEENISELGLDSSYTQPDTLEIMDLESDDTGDSSLTKDSNKTLDEIKRLIEDLKSKGEKIELEEFDFENMFQLIVKIEK